MQSLEAWRFDVGTVFDRLVLGLELFGPHAGWLWLFPAVWVVTTISLWFFMMRRQREADRVYLAYASRNLSILGTLAKRRAREVTLARRHDHGLVTSGGSWPKADFRARERQRSFIVKRPCRRQDR